MVIRTALGKGTEIERCTSIPEPRLNDLGGVLKLCGVLSQGARPARASSTSQRS